MPFKGNVQCETGTFGMILQVETAAAAFRSPLLFQVYDVSLRLYPR